MNKSIIINVINDKIKSLDIEKNSIIVLKGIPVNVVDSTTEKINLADIIDNKLKYFNVKNFDYPEKPLKYKHIRRISD